MHDLLNRVTVVSTLIDPLGVNGGPINLNATGDKFIFSPVNPADIYTWGVIFDAGNTVAGAPFVLSLDFRPIAGSDAGRVNKSTITRAIGLVSAAGSGLLNRVTLPVAATTFPVLGVGTGLLNVEPAGPLEVNPGQQAVIKVTAAFGAAATGYVFIDYVNKAMAGARFSTNITEVLL